jgi:hypothetical protein
MKKSTKIVIAAVIYIIIGCIIYGTLHSGNPIVNDLPVELFIFMFIFAGANNILSVFHSTSVFEDYP